MTLSNGQLPRLDAIPELPKTADAELVFKNPWEAKAFALVIQLYQQGHFSWPEWAQRLGAQIKAAGRDDNGEDYYLLWLATAEALIEEKSLCANGELQQRKSALEAQQGGPAPS